MKNRIDHVAIGADSLEQGSDAMQSLLGVSLTKGSKQNMI